MGNSYYSLSYIFDNGKIIEDELNKSAILISKNILLNNLSSLEDLKQKLGNILIGYNKQGEPIYAKQLKAEGAMAVLLKDALKPNLVQRFILYLLNNFSTIHHNNFKLSFFDHNYMTMFFLSKIIFII